MSDGLRLRYGADVSVLGPSQLTSPATLLAAVEKELIRPGEPLILVVTGRLTHFARKAGDVRALVLPNSIPGRPKSALRLENLVETAARVAKERSLLIGLDMCVEERAGHGVPGISAADLAEQISAACQTRFRWSPSIIVRASSIEHRASSIEHRASSIEHRASSIEHRASSIEHRASSIEHLLDRALAVSAAAGQDTDLDTVVTRAADVARQLGADASVLRSGRVGLIAPLRHFSPLPENVRDDLFAVDEGSRLDAALELAGLADAGHEQARHELDDLATRDPSVQVRNYAERLARRSTQPVLAMLRWNGRVPRHIFDMARHDLFLPELLHQPGGVVPIGFDGADPAEAPRHHIDLLPFRLSRTPVTDRQYLTFLIRKGGPCPDHWATDTDLWERDVDRPVVNVSFHDARRYCAWLDRLLHDRKLLTETEQVTLPSEVEWESAAGNGCGERHPWGERADPARCNIRASGLGRLTPVGTFSPAGDNATGCVDLIGNVWEWTRSAWGPFYRTPAHGYPYVADDGRENPDLPGVRRVIRGGAFYYATECANTHTRNRVLAEERHPGGGFRVAVTTVAPR